MDPETVLFIASAVLAAFWSTVIGILHVRGWLPRAYISRLTAIQGSTATLIGKTVSDALDAQMARLDANVEDVTDPFAELGPKLDALPAAIGHELEAALDRVAVRTKAEYVEEVKRLPPEVAGAMGGIMKRDNAKANDLKNAIGQGLLGPYGSILAQFMPPLYEYLVENPDMVVQALEMPVVQKLIQKAAAMAGNVTGKLQSTESGWGT